MHFLILHLVYSIYFKIDFAGKLSYKRKKIGVGAGHVALLRPHSTGGVGPGNSAQELRLQMVPHWALYQSGDKASSRTLSTV